jgi:hypothetical protein
MHRAEDARCILKRQGCDGGGGKAAKSRESLDVCY